MEEKANTVCIILNYNSAQLVGNLVKNIQNFDSLKNVVIVDNKSTDNSYQFLKNRFANNDKVVIISSHKNGGYGYGNNYGIKYASKYLHAQYAIIANPDVIFSNATVKKMLRCMQEKKAAIVSATQLLNNKVVNNRGWKIVTPYQWAFNELNHRPQFLIKDLYYSNKYFETVYSQVDCVPGAMFLVNISIFQKVGGYDERMFLYCEEDTLGYKLKKAGYKTYIINNIFYKHMHSATINKSIPDQVIQLRIMHKSKLIFLEKYLNVKKFTLLIEKILFSLITARYFLTGHIKKIMRQK
ncbi:MAG: glycosyltransferase family 2 protein [Lactobacillus kefiranofaciens]|uniref:glycosyltransferase n=1 Tax=Lactobacillus TaxID=1578 RepID=UPI001561BB93|nr:MULTISPECIES: glycosyltransferase family 2 protein [Lactobacillus]NRN85377.1 N-acetylglucosaminyl-diphospho-decaprenol L-rhamnosyltransferase [Lactobacillus helveticus]NRO00150.1 N-acetylglucosaminyl-diphospho-decaprenol L-rhamnosyltransferase [Lactobacillus helveticus]QNT43944.1 glycosyltransferase family 2 protein [Lactobacillus kefiranofaciens]